MDLGLWPPFLLQQGNGLYRVARALAIQVNAREGKSYVICDRQLDHRQPMVSGCDLSCGFVWGLPGGDKDHLIQGELVAGLFRHNQVTRVDGVECPANHTNAHRLSRFPLALILGHIWL
jgi:hypothetical protein